MIFRYFFWSSVSVVLGIAIAISFSEINPSAISYTSLFLHASASDIVTENNFIASENQATPVLAIGNILKEVVANETITKGLLMFRGNPSRNLYGQGPLPLNPEIKWRYPKSGKKMCSRSTSLGKTSLWCGSGWTGEPVVWEKENGQTEIIFGAYDGALHFVDSKTGEDLRKSFQTGDIIKGSGSLDPDGFPLYYFGSRDNKFRILALDRGNPVELWSLNSRDLHGIWNDDWDSNPVIIDDILYEGAENGWFYAIRLNRGRGEDGLVTVSPEIIFSMASYDDHLIKKVGRNVSVENSLTFFKDRVYFANSGGRVLGLDISNITGGIAPIVFDYWVGDDVDATIAVDDEGMLYVSSEYERFTDRSKELGQFMKLNPYKADDPYVWGLHLVQDDKTVGGIWATPALYGKYIFTSTHTGRLLEVDRSNGKIVWEEGITPHAWSSPVVVGDQLLMGTCGGEFRAYSLEQANLPVLDWTFQLSGSCIESTPAVWKGEIFVPARDGYFYAIGEKL